MSGSNAMARRDPFVRLVAAIGCSNLADGVGLVAVPLLAAQLTDDPLMVGSVAAVAYLPYLLLAAPIGVLVDRVERRRAMIAANLARSALLTVLVVGLVADVATIWWVFVIAFGFSTAECVFDNAGEATVVDLVPPDRLDRANAQLQTTMHVANLFAGGPVGAALFALTAALPFGAQALGHLAAAGLVAGLPASPAPVATGDGDVSSAWRELRVGMRWLADHRRLRSLAVASGVMSLATQLAQATIVLYVLDELGSTDVMFGLLAMVAALGAIGGSMVAPRLSGAFGRTTAMRATIVVQPLVLVGLGLAPEILVAGAAYFVYSGLIGIWNVLSVSLRQQLVPTALYGRVFGAWRTLVWGPVPVGAWLGGLVARTAGLRSPWFVGAAIFAAATALAWPGLRGGDDQLPASGSSASML